MSNHIHLLIKEGKENLEQIIKRIAGSYEYWYNWKYNRSGHLFQDRFKSEPVETDEYFLTVIRYIHQNPVKAKVTTDISKYEFSSYTEFLRVGSAIVDKEFVYSIIDKTKFIEFNLENNDDICLDIKEQNNRVNDSEAKEIIKQVCGSNPNIKSTEDGGAEPYTHSKDKARFSDDIHITDPENADLDWQG